jgi:SAM-dependent methyltransferase
VSREFQDHYSSLADSYARYRPRYPAALFEWLSSISPARTLAWDVGTGSGQVAVALAECMERVVATDASAGQLAHAVPHERVDYRHGLADSVSLANASIDLITAGAAAHWFELDGFYREVRRVAREGAIIALFSYGPRDIGDSIHAVVHRFQDEVLAGFWPDGFQHVNARYSTLAFPFEEIAAPSFTMTAEWTLEHVMAVLGTWSASQRYLIARGTSPLDEIRGELRDAWGEDEAPRQFQFPLFMRVGRVHGTGQIP